MAMRGRFPKPADGADVLGYATQVAGPTNQQPGAEARGSGRKIAIRNLVVTILLGLLLIVIAGSGGYLLGKGSGSDLESARDTGERAGWTKGTAIGGDDYPAGLATGQRITYPRTYRDAYRIAYRRAFKGSGIDVPDEDDVQVAVP
jgi:hypothetical protein